MNEYLILEFYLHFPEDNKEAPCRMFIQVAFPFGIKVEDVRIRASWKLPLGLGLINFFLVVKISHLNLFFPVRSPLSLILQNF